MATQMIAPTTPIATSTDRDGEIRACKGRRWGSIGAPFLPPAGQQVSTTPPAASQCNLLKLSGDGSHGDRGVGPSRSETSLSFRTTALNHPHAIGHSRHSPRLTGWRLTALTDGPRCTFSRLLSKSLKSEAVR